MTHAGAPRSRRGLLQAERAGGSDAGPDHVAGRAAKKVVKPVRRREVVRLYQDVFALTERRACRAMGIAGEGWAMDFMSDRLFGGRPFPILTIIDSHTREAL